MQQATPETRRIDSLDALRGIAALVVVLHHCLNALPTKPRWIAFSPLRLIDAGGQGAVLIFFTLSGFVLFLTFEKNDHWAYAPYVIKRVARIYLPFAAAILFSALLAFELGGRGLPQASAWFNATTWNSAVTAHRILMHLLMTDRSTYQDLDNVMWSLVQELRISVIFPLIALAVLRNWRLACGILLCVSTVAAVIWFRARPDLLFDPLSTVRYLFLFAAGSALALKRERVCDFVARRGLPARLALWGASLALITIPEVYVGGIIASAAAISLVAMSFADRPVDRALARPVPIWLGRVSYSLYLVHLPLIAVSLHVLSPRTPILLALAVAVIASLALSELAYRLIEVPSMRLGRKLAARWIARPPQNAADRDLQQDPRVSTSA